MPCHHSVSVPASWWKVLEVVRRETLINLSPQKKKLGVCALPSALNGNDYHTILAGWLAVVCWCDMTGE